MRSCIRCRRRALRRLCSRGLAKSRPAPGGADAAGTAALESGATRTLLRLRRGLLDVFGADVVCGEEGKERCALSGGFDGGTAVCFLALDNAYHSGDDHSGFARGLDGRDGRAAGGADVVDDDDARAGLEEAFDAAGCSMLFFGLAYEEAVDEATFARGRGIRLRGPIEGALGAGGGDVGDDGVSAHGEAADGFGLDVAGFEQFKNGVTGEAAALGVEGGGAAVDVVIAGCAGGEGKVAEAEAEAGEERQKLLDVGRGGHRF
jgi:hypothetical protein